MPLDGPNGASGGARHARARPRGAWPAPRGERYKWIALSNCTLGVLLATLDASITLIAMPDIFRGIRLDPLIPSNSFYLLWMILGFLVVSSVLIVSLGGWATCSAGFGSTTSGSSSTRLPRCC